MTALDETGEAATTEGNRSQLYTARHDRFAALASEHAGRSGRLANLRLLAFLGGLGAGGAAFALSVVPLWGLAVALLVLFAGLVVAHRRVERARRRYETLRRLNAEALARLARDWAALPVRHTARAEPGHPYAADLDLFGRASLCHLLDTTATAGGERTLADWLLATAPPATLRERQAAAAELAPLVDWRDELRVRAEGSGDGDGRVDPAAFLAWAESAPLLVRHRTLVWVARISPLVLWLLLAAQIGDLTAYPLWVPLVILNGAIALALVGRAAGRLGAARSAEQAFRGYADAFALVADTAFAAPALRAAQARLGAEGEPAHHHMARLHSLTRFIIPPSAMFYLPVQMLTLWDIHLLGRLERWQVVAGQRARDWLAAQGEVEAMAALGTLAHDQPGWAMPDLDPEADAYRATDLGHPLLSDAVRVVNDVEIGPPGSFLLVTGSNMSGKSTLLRAIGTNAVLAGLGAPVCAARLRLPPVRLWTSMRITDSLEQGVSYFMAELQRLKQVVDAATRQPGPGPEATAPRLLYLLDEILQGTNTAERQIAARRIIRHLVAQGALGAVSTHDLSLAASEDLADAGRPVHFTETFSRDDSGPHLHFDYRMRPGLARSTNALKLMEVVGLALDEPAE